MELFNGILNNNSMEYYSALKRKSYQSVNRCGENLNAYY